MGKKKKPVITPFEGNAEILTSTPEGVLFNDERFKNRKEVLDLFFKPKQGCESLSPNEESLLRAGNSLYASINPRSSFICPQIREMYDYQRIVRLGCNMRDGPDGQLQNIGIAFIDPDSLERYLDDMNFYFGSDIQPSDIHFHPEFKAYVITVYGHNRQLGAASANLETSGNPDVGINVFAKVLENPPFWRVLENQAVENSGEPPEIWQRSRSIVMYKELRERDKELVSQVDIAKKFNVDVDQIWRAERYEALPKPIKDLVMAVKIPYSSAIELDALRDLYGEEYMVDLAYSLSSQFPPSRKKVLDAVRKRLAAKKLTPEVLALIEKDRLTLPQAEELAKLAGFIESDEINSLATWICIHKPTIEDIRKRVETIIRQETHGEQGLFSSGLLSAEDAARYLEESRRAALLRNSAHAISRVHDHVTSLHALLNAGLMGPVIDDNPLAREFGNASLNVALSNLCTMINIDPSLPLSELPTFLEKVKLTSTDNAVVSRIDEVLKSVNELLVTEAAETAITQAQRRRELAANIFETTKSVAPVQEELFG